MQCDVVLIKNIFNFFFVLAIAADFCSLDDATCPHLIMMKFRFDNVIIKILRNKVIKAVLTILRSLIRWKDLRKPETVLESIGTVTLRGNLHANGTNIRVSKIKEKRKTLPDFK